jgi:hypothetical protein
MGDALNEEDCEKEKKARKEAGRASHGFVEEEGVGSGGTEEG